MEGEKEEGKEEEEEAAAEEEEAEEVEVDFAAARELNESVQPLVAPILRRGVRPFARYYDKHHDAALIRSFINTRPCALSLPSFGICVSS